MGYYFTTTCERMMRVFVLFFFIYSAVACTSNLECGSADDSAPGLCENGICQCGVGYSGNQPIDPTSCSLVCAPPPVPDAVAFLKEPNVTVGASAGNLVMDINMDPYLNQIPATVAFLNPTNGSACALMAAQLGAGAWSRTRVCSCNTWPRTLGSPWSFWTGSSL